MRIGENEIIVATLGRKLLFSNGYIGATGVTFERASTLHVRVTITASDGSVQTLHPVVGDIMKLYAWNDALIVALKVVSIDKHEVSLRVMECWLGLELDDENAELTEPFIVTAR